jgi:hypothetical protein
MSHNTRRAALAAKQVSLRSAATAFSTAGLEVDEPNGVLKNVAVMSVGPAVGHGFVCDATTLQQCAALINADADGIVLRFVHPDENPDGTMEDMAGRVVGRLRNARVDGNILRGDAYLGDYAAALPGLGDVRTYLVGLAKGNPKAIGLSPVINFDVEPVMGPNGPTALAARVVELKAVDFVGDPATNRNGLLAAVSPKACTIRTMMGDRPVTISGPTPDDALRMHSGLSGASAAPTQSTPDQNTTLGVSPGIAPTRPVAPAKTLSTGGPMDPTLKGVLVSEYGLDPSASDETAQAFFSALSAEEQAEAQSMVSAAGSPPADPAAMPLRPPRRPPRRPSPPRWRRGVPPPPRPMTSQSSGPASRTCARWRPSTPACRATSSPRRSSMASTSRPPSRSSWRPCGRRPPASRRTARSTSGRTTSVSPCWRRCRSRSCCGPGSR